MKTIRLTIFSLFLPLIFSGQTLTGIWTGTISNDSASIRKDQSFEIVLTQYRNKVYGYSRSTFTVNDTFYYIVKRVLGDIAGDVCEVKDDHIVAYNFKGRLDKGVKMVSTFHFDPRDSVWKMDGDWKTNKTRKYYSVSGKMELKEEKDFEKSKIFPHLEELNLADDVAFYKESKKTPEPVAAIKEPIKEKQKVTKRESVAKTKPVTEEVKKEMHVTITAKEETLITDKPQPQKSEPVVATKQMEKKKEPATESVNTEAKKQDVVSATVPSKEKEKPIFKASAPEDKPVIAPAAAQVAERKIAAPQVINFKSDSLELALYDNGEVDGDTVSVLLNGEVIIAKQGLKASAIKKTIYLTPGKDDSIMMVLYAENLGKYPPNTGLLIVHDGDDSYQIRFSADLQQNAAVIFKRRKK
jgi:hypothetical protein